MDHIHTEQTLEYYNKNADAFAFSMQKLDFKETQNAFLNYLPQQSAILDFGCGAGRDTKYFLNLGYRVTAIDGSEELCRKATLYTGSQVRQMLFQELDSVDCYDGIWACSSILHLSMDELKIVLNKMAKALTKEGIVYTSFKYGSFEGMRNGRYFTDLNEQKANELIKETDVFTIREMWLTSDIRTEIGEEKWLNLILQKK